MAGRPPISIKILQGAGRKHLTKVEIERRTSDEKILKPAIDKVKKPDGLLIMLRKSGEE